MPPLSNPMPAFRAASRAFRPTQRAYCTQHATRIPRNFPSSAHTRRQPPALSSIRFYSTEISPETKRPLTDRGTSPDTAEPQYKKPVPEYQMTFTCKPCNTRSSHRISKQGYHSGSVLITCPECKNKHIISDHLNIFGNKNMTVEDFMREQGQLVKKGTLSEDGSLEFWSDGSTTERIKGGKDGGDK